MQHVTTLVKCKCATLLHDILLDKQYFLSISSQLCSNIYGQFLTSCYLKRKLIDFVQRHMFVLLLLLCFCFVFHTNCIFGWFYCVCKWYYYLVLNMYGLVWWWPSSKMAETVRSVKVCWFTIFIFLLLCN